MKFLYSFAKKNNNERRGTLAFCALIFVFTLLIYGNTIPNGYSVDDEIVVNNNKTIQKGLWAIPEIFTTYYVSNSEHSYGYRPIAKASFAVEYFLWGFNPHLSHLVNIIIYFLCCLFSYLIFKVLFRMNEGNSLFLKIATILFICHPVHTEAVASLKNREELLCYLFGIISTFLIFQYFRRKKIVLMISGIFFLVSSIASKQNGIVFAGLIPLTVIFFRPTGTLNECAFSQKIFYLLRIAMPRRIIQAVLVFFGSAVALIRNSKTVKRLMLAAVVFSILILVSILSVRVPQKVLPPRQSKIEKWHNPLYTEGSKQLTATLALNTNYFYLSKLIIPHPLLYYYGFNMVPSENFFTFKTIVSLLAFILLIGLAVLLFRHRHILSYCILFYYISIGIFLNILMPVAGIVGERLVFISSWAYCLFFVFLLFMALRIPVMEKFPFRNAKGKTFLFIISIVVVVFSYKTYSRNKSWESVKSIAEADIGKLENSFFANTFYASLLEDEYNRKRSSELLKKVIRYYKKGLAVYPAYDIGWNNLGRIYLQELNNPDSAIYFLKNSIALNDRNEFAYCNLGYAFELKGEYGRARQNYKSSIKANQRFSLGYLMLANLYYYKIKKIDSALFFNMQVTQMEPMNEVPYVNMGNYRLAEKDTAGAIELYEKAFSLNQRNKDLANNLYNYFAGKGNYSKADYYRRQLNP